MVVNLLPNIDRPVQGKQIWGRVDGVISSMFCCLLKLSPTNWGVNGCQLNILQLGWIQLVVLSRTPLLAGWFSVAPEPLPPDVLSQAPAPVPTPEDLEKLAGGAQVGGPAIRSVQDPSQDSQAIGHGSPSDNSLDNGEEAQALGRVAASQLLAESPPKSAVGTSSTDRNIRIEAGGDEAKPADAEAAIVNESLSVLLDRESQRHGQAVVGTAAGEQQPAAAAREPASGAAQPAKKKKGNREEDYWLSFAGAMQSNVLTKILDSGDEGGWPLLAGIAVVKQCSNWHASSLQSIATSKGRAFFEAPPFFLD
jgi:hypothetical protein